LIGIFENYSGVRKDILKNIFTPFATSKAIKQRINLSLCKQIICLHKGPITVKSIEGEGSVFSLVF
jgi:signal transduction histidine kinase